MNNYQSVAARVPAEHKENAEIVFSLLVGDQIGFVKQLATTPHPTEEGFAQEPATHFGMNNEGSPPGLLEKIAIIKGGIGNGIDDVLPGVEWGTNGLPTKEQAIAAIVASGAWQRLDEEQTPEEHFLANCAPGGPDGLKVVWND